VTLRHRLNRVGRRTTESSPQDGRTLLDVRDGVSAPLVVPSPFAEATREAVAAERVTATNGVARHPKNAPVADEG